VSIGEFHILLSVKIGHPAMVGDAEALSIKVKRAINRLKRQNISLIDLDIPKKFI